MSGFVVTPQFITPKELVFWYCWCKYSGGEGRYNDINSIELLGRYSELMPCYPTLSSGFHRLSSYDSHNCIQYVFCSGGGGGGGSRKWYQWYSLLSLYNII